jgi:pilus assembly protein Flp/PilA
MTVLVPPRAWCPVPGGTVPSGHRRTGWPLAASKGQPMLKYYVIVRNFLADPLPRGDRGATAVEYGLIVALIAAAIAAILLTLGGTIKTWFTNINADF